MDDIASLLQNNDYNFIKKINSNTYIESIKNKVTKYTNFLFCLLDNYDLILSNTPSKDKNIVFHKRISEILSQIDEENLCEKYKYNSKKFKSRTIQKNILDCSKDKNNLLISCIYFFNDYYQTHFKLVNTKNSMILDTCVKNYPIVYIHTDNNNYYIDKKEPNFTSKEYILKDLSNDFFVLDIDLKNVYKLYLEAINKYKLDELKDIANEKNITLEIKMKKKDIYDKINIHMLNLI
tara:strand:+ start:375 stop:1082 length:708 start_codon:yes stop_codon:yes gene_type:complete